MSTAKPVVAVVEDEPALRQLLAAYLQRAGFAVQLYEDGATALAGLRDSTPGLVILDVLLPKLDGFSVLERLQNDGAAPPVLLLTAKSTEADRLRGLQLGADDYVTKPFSPAEVVLRVEAILRRVRGGPPASRTRTVAGITVDEDRHLVEVAGQPITLTPTEFRLLTLLIHRPGWTLTRQQLLDGAVGTDFLGYDRNVDVHVANLRKKLGLRPSPIHTVYGVGYRFEPPEDGGGGAPLPS
ncbi:MAG: response regulator transcription factor [Thermaerobacter sp.]|nr:response regulator transcription factor [Thermaerobacter sp.]